MISAVPYIGDAAKLGKLGKWASTIANAVELAAKNPKMLKLLEPALKKISDLIGALPKAGFDALPKSAQDMLSGAKSKIDDLLGAGAKAFSAGVEATAKRLGISPEKVQAILDAPKGSRPDPASYMSKEQIAAHLAKFDDGAVRFISRSDYAKYGTLGPTPGFVLPKSELNQLLKEAGGNLFVVEKKLGLETGTLQSKDTMIVLIERKDIPDLKIPSGNEKGANELWLPGGVTSGGTSEAILGLPKDLPFKEIKIN